jgi:hypothetical protein
LRQVNVIADFATSAVIAGIMMKDVTSTALNN